MPLTVCLNKGKGSPPLGKLTDLSTREMLTVTPLIIAVFVVGLYPGPLLKAIDGSVTEVVERIEPRRKAVDAPR